ncbi:hypothetical protein EDC96DRAFT_245719 [Choanephora cucurbitarum]|nr:hypothetical protein EDC96DRAFT_245719 [Choanephora cucurbitarum]
MKDLVLSCGSLTVVLNSLAVVLESLAVVLESLAVVLDSLAVVLDSLALLTRLCIYVCVCVCACACLLYPSLYFRSYSGNTKTPKHQYHKTVTTGSLEAKRGNLPPVDT